MGERGTPVRTERPRPSGRAEIPAGKSADRQGFGTGRAAECESGGRKRGLRIRDVRAGVTCRRGRGTLSGPHGPGAGAADPGRDGWRRRDRGMARLVRHDQRGRAPHRGRVAGGCARGVGPGPTARRGGAGVAEVAGRGGHRLRDRAVGLDDHAAGGRGRRGSRPGEPGAASGPAHRPRERAADGDGPDRRQPAGVRGARVPRPAAVRGAGVGAADPGARGRLLGPGQGRAVRPAAGPRLLRGRRPAQHRRRRAGRAGVAPLVAPAG